MGMRQEQISGVELEGTYDWRDGYVTIAGTHINGKNISNPNVPLLTIPDRISGTLGLRFLNEKLTVGSRLTLVAASQTFNAAALANPAIFSPTSSYALVDLFASYKYDDNISANLIVQNLLNKEYTQYLNTLTSPGLTVKASLTVRFASR